MSRKSRKTIHRISSLRPLSRGAVVDLLAATAEVYGKRVTYGELGDMLGVGKDAIAHLVTTRHHTMTRYKHLAILMVFKKLLPDMVVKGIVGDDSYI